MYACEGRFIILVDYISLKLKQTKTNHDLNTAKIIERFNFQNTKVIEISLIQFKYKTLHMISREKRVLGKYSSYAKRPTIQ